MAKKVEVGVMHFDRFPDWFEMTQEEADYLKERLTNEQEQTFQIGSQIFSKKETDSVIIEGNWSVQFHE